MLQIDPVIYTALAFGAAGGFVRGVLGIKKEMDAQGAGFKMDWPLLVLSVFTAAVIGAAAGFIDGKEPTVIFLAGFAGQDALESLLAIGNTQVNSLLNKQG